MVRLLVLTLSDTVRPTLRTAPRLSAAAVQTDTQANIQTFLPTGEFAYRLPGLLSHPAQPLFSESFHSRQEWWPFTGLPEQKASTAVSCWEKENRAQQQWTWPSSAAETMENVVETESRKKSMAEHSRHMLEMWALVRRRADVDLTKADIDENSLAACLLFSHELKLCFYCFHSDE